MNSGECEHRQINVHDEKCRCHLHRRIIYPGVNGATAHAISRKMAWILVCLGCFFLCISVRFVYIRVCRSQLYEENITQFAY